MADPLARLGSETGVVAFGAPWCGPWRLLERTIAELVADGANIVFVDVDIDPGTAERCSVVSLPTFCRFEGGKEKRRLIGAVGPAELRKLAGLPKRKPKTA